MGAYLILIFIAVVILWLAGVILLGILRLIRAGLRRMFGWGPDPNIVNQVVLPQTPPYEARVERMRTMTLRCPKCAKTAAFDHPGWDGSDQFHCKYCGWRANEQDATLKRVR